MQTTSVEALPNQFNIRRDVERDGHHKDLDVRYIGDAAPHHREWLNDHDSWPCLATFRGMRLPDTRCPAMLRRLLPVMLLIGCTPAKRAADAPPAAETTVVAPAVGGDSGMIAAAFLCADSTQVFALFRSVPGQPAEVALAIDDDRLHLPQLRSASGARYGDSTTTFWNKGDSATFTRRGTTTTCHVVK